ncbi:hypothetical protein [Bacillus sp. ISL-37]|uniref:hypothetical protein n=1 Tax=Bacillus sp. ISL-37 TaxID=2819123 RepID=UPI001BEAC906|nr:hypothetical protein [Bacillus sp. ISL-37]MBT2683630.1 hypothetical protein [Bacillus sp. ISL-37]
MKSFFDFIGRTEIEKYSRLPRNTETGGTDKEALFASAGGAEVSEFLGGDTRQATRGARRWSWIKKTIYSYPLMKLFYNFLGNKKIRDIPDFLI